MQLTNARTIIQRVIPYNKSAFQSAFSPLYPGPRDADVIDLWQRVDGESVDRQRTGGFGAAMILAFSRSSISASV